MTACSRRRFQRYQAACDLQPRPSSDIEGHRGCSSVVERQLPKLNVAGSTPVTRFPDGLVPVDVWQALTAVEGLRRGCRDGAERGPVRPVDTATVDKTLPELGPVVRGMVELQLLTGMRPGEVCRMSWEEIDTDGKVWFYRPTAHKNAHRGHTREIAIGPKGQTLLMRFRDRPEKSAVFSPAENLEQINGARRAARTTPMTPSHRARSKTTKPTGTAGDRYSTDSYARAIARACERAGVEHWAPNQLRHTAATRFRELAGVDAAQVMLDHRHVDTAMIYAENSRNVRSRVAKEYG
jgi:integrase